MKPSDRRVKELRAAGIIIHAVKVPIGLAGGNVARLTEGEIAKCKKLGVDPAKYLATRAAIRARTSRR